MSSEYKKSTQSQQEKHSASVESNDNKRWKRYQRCYVEHSRSSCPWKESICYRCGEKGHLKSVCKSKNILKKPFSRISSSNQVGTVFSCLNKSSPKNEDFGSNLYQRVGKQIYVIKSLHQWKTGFVSMGHCGQSE